MLDIALQFAATETESAESGLAALGIDPVAILIQSGTFLLLFFLIKKYALDNINQKLTDREETINEGIENAHKAEKASQEAIVKQQEILNDARADADKIIADAHEQTGEMLAKAQAEAEAKSKKMLEDTRSQLESEVAKARKQLEDDVFELTARASEVVLGEKMDSASDDRLIKKAVAEAKR